MMVIDTLYEVVKKLDSINVPYMLSGSLAMGFYTVSRSTYDIDLIVYLKESDIDNMEAIFADDYFYKPTVAEEIKKNGMFNIIKSKGGFKIDFILVKNDEYSRQAFQNRISLTDYGEPIFVISLEDLIIAKLKWIQDLYSERQYSDIKNLLSGNTPNLEYIKLWTEKMKLNTYKLFEDE
jgi:hypothetical protein